MSRILCIVTTKPRWPGCEPSTLFRSKVKLPLASNNWMATRPRRQALATVVGFKTSRLIFRKQQTELRIFEEALRHAADQNKSSSASTTASKANYAKFRGLVAEAKSDHWRWRTSE